MRMVLVVFWLLSAFHGFALEIAPGLGDPLFAPGLPPAFAVSVMRGLPTGSAVLAGSSSSQPSIVLLSPNGVRDPILSLDPTIQGSITDVFPQSGGGYLIVGAFTAPTNSCIFRLDPTGRLDPAFRPVKADGPPRFVAQSPSGSILIAGPFATLVGKKRFMLGLLNADGSLDEGFDPQTSVVGSDPSQLEIRCVMALEDNSFLVGGRFLSYRGVVVPGLMKLRRDASLANDFLPALRPSSVVETNRCNAIGRQKDGKLILLGTFVRGDHRPARLLRMELDGRLDPTFASPAFDGAQFSQNQLAVDDNDRIWIGGSILRRMLPNGSPDPTFWDERPLAYAQGIGLAPLGNRWMLVNASGGLVAIFREPQGSAPSAPSVVNAEDYTTMIYPEGSLLATQPMVVGTPTPKLQWLLNKRPLLSETNLSFVVPWVTRSNMGTLALVASNQFGVVTQVISTVGGTIADRSYNMVDPGKRFDEIPLAEVQVLRADGQGKMFAGGLRTPILGRPAIDLFRMDQNRHLDGAFLPQFSHAPTRLFDVAQSSNGLVAVSGSYQVSNSQTQHVLWIFDENGSMRREIAAGGGPIYRVLAATGGGWWLGGDFTTLDASAQPRLARLSLNGEFLPFFTPATVPDKGVRSLAESRSGGLWVVGDFKQMGTESRIGMALISSAGTLDSSFLPLTGFDRSPTEVIQPADDSVWVVGPFLRYQGKSARGVLRLNLAGEPQADGLVLFSASALGTDALGRVWVGGASAAGARLLPNGSQEPGGHPPRSPAGTSFERFASFPSGDVVVAGALSDPSGNWRSPLAVLMGSDEVATEPPVLFGELTYPNVLPGFAAIVASASGHGLTYKWYFGDIPSFERSDIPFGYIYSATKPDPGLRVVVSNAFGSVTSSPPFYFSTNLPRRIAGKQLPPQVMLAPGEPGLWAIEYLRPRPPSHLIQWFRDNAAISSEDGLLFIPSVTPSDDGSYRGILAGESAAFSTSFRLRVVNSTPGANEALETTNRLFDTSQELPWSAIPSADLPSGLVFGSSRVTAGQSSWLDLRVFGKTKLTFRWKLETTAGAGIALCSVNGLELARLSAASDWVETTVNLVGNPAAIVRWALANNGPDGAETGRLLLDWIRISDGLAPSVVIQPESRKVTPGTPVKLLPWVTVSPPADYQWYRNGMAVPGATSPYLNLDSVDAGSVGEYTLSISNQLGVVSTGKAMVDLITAPTVILRWSLEAGGDVLHIDVTSESGGEILIESSADLEHWNLETILPGGTGDRSVELLVDRSADSRFVRARLP